MTDFVEFVTFSVFAFIFFKYCSLVTMTKFISAFDLKVYEYGDVNQLVNNEFRFFFTLTLTKENKGKKGKKQ